MIADNVGDYLYELGQKDGHEQGREEGREEERQKLLESARRMYKSGISIEQIVE